MRNIRLLRSTNLRSEVFPTISILIPARNEANSIPRLIESLRKLDYPNFEVVIMDDDSSDETFDIATNAIQDDMRFRLIQHRGDVTQGWLGKSWVCQQLSLEATGEIFCFIDADVTLSPSALTRSIHLLNGLNVDIICPYPRQTTTTFFSRLVQPLLQWSWMATLPLDLALKSPRTSLVAGNGQFLMIRSDMYRRIGGHTSVKNEVLEDIELVRAVKRAGGTGGVWDGSDFAECTMYRTNAELIHGYSKSLWRAFGSIPKGLFISLSLVVFFLLPFFTLWTTDTLSKVVAVVAIFASLLSRMLVHHQHKYPVTDAIFYPLSFIAFAFLMMVSCERKIRGTIVWKDRVLNG